MHGAGAAVVAGVERGQQVAHLRAADLADDQPVGPHPQRLPDQVAQRDPAGALDVGRPGHQPDHVRVPGPQLLGVLDDQQPLRGSTALSSAARMRGLAGAGAAGDQEREPGGQHGAQQRLAGGVDGAERAQGRQVVRGGPQHPQRQAGAVGGDRGQHGVQPDPGVGEPAVDVRAGVVEPAAGRDGQPLGEPADGGLVGEAQPGGLEAGSAVDPDRGRAADQDVGGARVAQQLVERAGADELLAQQPQRGQHVEVGGDPAGLGPDGGGHRGRRGVAAGRGQPGADAVDQPGSSSDRRLGRGRAGAPGRRHGRRHRVGSGRAARSSTVRAAPASGPRGDRAASPRSSRRGQPRLGAHRREQRQPERPGDLRRRRCRRGPGRAPPAAPRPQCSASTAATRAAAAHERTSAGTTSTVRSARGRARRRRPRWGSAAGRTRPVSPARRPASMTDRDGRRRRDRRPTGRRTAGPARRRRDRRRPGAGSAACSAVAGTRPPPTVDLGPAQAGEVLGAEHQVQPAAQRVAVDQQRPLRRRAPR